MALSDEQRSKLKLDRKVLSKLEECEKLEEYAQGKQNVIIKFPGNEELHLHNIGNGDLNIDDELQNKQDEIFRRKINEAFQEWASFLNTKF